MSPSPLHDLTVIELADDAAGAFCAKSLADLGARVIKVEPREGDPLRKQGPFAGGEPHPERGALFLWLNTGKESITVDITTSDGRLLLDQLLDLADVFVVSGATPRVQALSLDRIAARLPGLVITRISPFGSTGPHADWKSDDLIQYAMAGWMNATGLPEREPLASGGGLASTIVGLAAASAALMGVHERQRSGDGQLIDVSAQEVLTLLLPYSTVMFSYMGIERPRNGMPFPMTIVPAENGYLGINVLTQSQWEMLCAFTGMTDLLESPDYSDPTGRGAHAQELTQRFAEWAADRQKERVFAEGQKWRVPFGFVPHLGEVFDLPPHVDRSFFEQVEHPEAGVALYPRAPFIIEGAEPIRPAPLRGQHTAQILSNLPGYDEGDLARLRDLEVV